MKRQQTLVYEPPLPSERVRQVHLSTSSGDAIHVIRCLGLIAERCERTSSRLRGVAPELRSCAARLCRIAAAVDDVLGDGR